jgi:hypothetical protein
MTFLVNSEQTDGAFSMTDYFSKPGNEPPAHEHDREDEFLYVLEAASIPLSATRSLQRVRMKE